MSTAYPQLVPMLVSWLPTLFSSAAMLIALYVAFSFKREFPGKSLITSLKKEVDRLDGELGDLEARFTRFQKRRGMQEAREAKTASADALAEAAAIVASQSGPAATGMALPTGSDPQAVKMALRQKMRGH